MPFTLSAAQTIDGVANSYVVTGSGNLDDLATACVTIGMTRSANVITFSPTANMILGISGALTEERSGTRTLNIRNGGHICWGYDTSSVITLGKYDSTAGVYTGSVDIVYESNALAVGSDVFSTARGRCLVGNGTVKFVSGSVSYNHSARSDLDIFDGVTSLQFDNFRVYLTDIGLSYTHMWKPSGKVSTTSNTTFTFIQRPMEGPAATTLVTPFYTDIGFRWLFPSGSAVCRLEKPTYLYSDIWEATSSSVAMNVIDPLTDYQGVIPAQNAVNHPGIKRIYRTVSSTFVDNFGLAINGTVPKFVTVFPNSSTSVSNFSNSAVSVEVLQSTRNSGVSYDGNGNGWNNEGNYSFHAVAFGYAAAYLSVNVRTARAGTKGVTWSATSAKSPLVTSAYASVVTAPFSMNTTNNTLTISANATTAQVAEYLFKLAYDNADQAFWRSLNHTPAVVSGTSIDFGSLNIVVSGGTLTGAGLKTTGIVTVTGGSLENINVIGNVSQPTPANISGVGVSGTLSYNTNFATSITFTNCTIGTLVNNGTGIVTITQTASSVTTYTDAEINYLDSFITFTGCNSGDSVRVRRVSNNAILFTHPISLSSILNFKLGANAGVSVYFERVNSSGAVVTSTFTTANRTLALGDNGSFELVDPATVASLAGVKAYFDAYGWQVVWQAPNRTLTEGGGVTLAEIEASEVLAKSDDVAAIKATTDSIKLDTTRIKKDTTLIGSLV